MVAPAVRPAAGQRGAARLTGWCRRATQPGRWVTAPASSPLRSHLCTDGIFQKISDSKTVNKYLIQQNYLILYRELLMLFKMVLADMTIPVAGKGERSFMAQMGYGKIVVNLQTKLLRITKFIPKVFDEVLVTITPHNFPPTLANQDALVLIAPSIQRSGLSKTNRTRAINDNDILGMTEFGDGPITAVVFLDRCVPGSIEHFTNAAIHEIGHAKSGLGEEMHIQNPNGILAKKGGAPGRAFTDQDAKWLSNHLPKSVAFDMRHFSSGSGVLMGD